MNATRAFNVDSQKPCAVVAGDTLWTNVALDIMQHVLITIAIILIIATSTNAQVHRLRGDDASVAYCHSEEFSKI